MNELPMIPHKIELWVPPLLPDVTLVVDKLTHLTSQKLKYAIYLHLP